MSQEKSEKNGMTRSPTMSNLNSYTEKEESRENVPVRKLRKKVDSFLQQEAISSNFYKEYKTIKESLNPSDLITVYTTIINLLNLTSQMEKADKTGKHKNMLLNALLAKSYYLFAACTFYYELSAPIDDMKVHLTNRKMAYEALKKGIDRGLDDGIHIEAYELMVSFHNQSKEYDTYRQNAQKKANLLIWQENLRKAVVHTSNCAKLTAKINETPELYLEHATLILDHALDKDIHANTAEKGL